MNFAQWYQNVCNKLTKSGQIKALEKEFVTQANDFDRISILYQSQEILKSEEVTESFCRKDNKQSESYRSIGNKLYRSSSLQNTVQAYTRAIKHAESNSSTLSLGYANRSAVLFAMGELSFCRADILLALENGYPEELRHKLYERIGKCYQNKGLHEEALNSFDSCLKSIPASNLTKEKQEEKLASLNLLMVKCNISKSSTNKNFEPGNHIYVPNVPLIHDPNDIYLSASQSFSMKSDKVHGRYAIATKDIKAGEVVIIEKPFASVCLPNCYDTHCYHCLTRFKYAYPCRNCSSISYCSTDCEKQSWISFHQYECSYMNLLINDDVGLGHLAMKVVLKNKIEDLKGFQELYDTKQNDFGLSEDNVFDPQSYFCLFSLVGNSVLRKHADLFRRSLLAIFLTKILQGTGYVGRSDEKMQITVAGHLLKQIQMLPCNAHEVSEAQLVGSDLASNELKEIGSAAYTTLSLLNHSCDPSVVRHCYRDVCVVRALKHIKKGEEIIDNYGFLYAVQEKIERKKHLEEQYYFTCQCAPCIEDWPLYLSLKDDLPTFKCSFCPGKVDAKTYKCYSCGVEDSNVRLFYENEQQELYESTVQKVLNGDGSNNESNLEILLEYLNLLTKKAILPNIHVNNCQEVVKLCFSLSANFARL